jgi:5-methyltetrahydrofolate--homocysteine methyltransferase
MADDYSEIFNEISEFLQKGRARDIVVSVQKALDGGAAPADILENALMDGMNIIGGKFKRNEVFVPEVLIAARAMNKATEILKPHLAKAGVNPVGKAIICTVKGDLHDIGKNLVKMMIEGKGIEVEDLGVDCDTQKVVDKVKEGGAKVLCLSALLTTTMTVQKDVIDALKDAGIRDKVKVMVGGAPVTQGFADEIGADAYTPDAASAAEVCRAFYS